MKMLFTKKILIVLLVATGFCLPSCIDENADVDFGEAFKNIGITDGKIEMPLVKGVTANLGDLLEKVKSPTDAATIGYENVGNDKDVVTIYYTHPDATEHEMRKINDDFETFNGEMFNLEISDLLADNQAIPQWILGLPGVNVTVPPSVEETHTEFVSFGSTRIDDKSKLDRVEFKNVKLRLKVNTNIATQSSDFLQFSIVLPADPNQPGSTAQTIDLPMNTDVPFSGTILCDATRYGDDATKIALIVKLKGDGRTQVTNSSTVECSLNFDTRDDASDFVAWGWFNYVLADGVADADIKQEDLPADIQQYLSDGTVLVFDDPRLQFEVESQIGVPLRFTMVELNNHSKDGISYPISNEYEFDIAQAEWVGNVEIAEKDTFEVNKNTFTQGNDGQNYRDMFRSNLESLSLHYKVTTQPVDINNIGTTPIQHLSKFSKINVRAKATLPLILGDGSVLKYKETEEVDFSSADVSIEKGKATIYLGYKNTLPLAMSAKIEFLEEDETTVVKAFDIQLKKTTDPNKWETEELSFDETVINRLKDIKYMRIDYSSETVTNIAVFKKSDAITLRLAVEATKITIGMNDLDKENENQ